MSSYYNTVSIISNTVSNSSNSIISNTVSNSSNSIINDIISVIISNTVSIISVSNNPVLYQITFFIDALKFLASKWTEFKRLCENKVLFVV
ncbi:hypothetical protein CWI38_0022p0080 [Hamiltosporidium tvaerminnensis]|uniref:Uncharacterized protein n=1 Tax=Hamiltosporidium tvaerminnensis TaxID=1176355 RepID=A0A4Q9M455_9MICR|nr:hypothetical protein CWI38_0022p0080 [Hamiltosporidium tvaerminnensis]